jgi:hypothetical protein
VSRPTMHVVFATRMAAEQFLAELDLRLGFPDENTKTNTASVVRGPVNGVYSVDVTPYAQDDLDAVGTVIGRTISTSVRDGTWDIPNTPLPGDPT